MAMSFTEIIIEPRANPQAPVRVTRRSGLTGEVHTRTIENGVVLQIRQWVNGDGGFIQDIMPQVSKDDREFIMSGITPEEWDAML